MRVKKTTKLETIYNLNENGIFNEDCIAGSKKHIPDESVDLIICDPPFGNKETGVVDMYSRENKNVIEGYKEAPADYARFSFNWIEQCKRILKVNGSLQIISGWSNLHHVLNAVRALDLKLVNHLIWKYNFGVRTTKKFVTAHYQILYITKNNAKPTFNTTCRFSCLDKDVNGLSLLDRDMESVWNIPKEYHRGKTKNLNKLPAELMRKMIQYSSNENDIVCDFFLGNFTTAFAAKSLRRKFTGFEINSNSYNHFMPVYDDAKYGEGI